MSAFPTQSNEAKRGKGVVKMPPPFGLEPKKTYHAGQPPLRDDSSAMRGFSDDEGAVARVVGSG